MWLRILTLREEYVIILSIVIDKDQDQGQIPVSDLVQDAISNLDNIPEPITHN